jgi:SRSO17 transposase
LCYASAKGAAFIDRELYLPEEEWALDSERREKAGVPEEVRFRTKPRLAHQMLKRALLEGGVRASWVVADCLYGDARYLGAWLEEEEQPYVLGLSGKAHVWLGLYQPKVSELLDALREGRLPRGGEGWARLSAGDGSKGKRLYEWIRLALNDPLQEGFRRWLLVRRQIDDPEKLSAYVVFAPEDTPLEDLARVAGSRWQVEVAFEAAKGEVGLDHYEVRSWDGWYRHVTLALFAHAFLSAIRATGQDIEAPKKGEFFGRQASSSLAAFKRGRGL